LEVATTNSTWPWNISPFPDGQWKQTNLSRQVRMVCQWAFRTFSPKNDTEISYRGVPGIRVPGELGVDHGKTMG